MDRPSGGGLFGIVLGFLGKDSLRFLDGIVAVVRLPALLRVLAVLLDPLLPLAHDLLGRVVGKVTGATVLLGPMGIK